MSNEPEQKVQDALLAFVDFLYAVVFGLVLAQLFDQVISAQVAQQIMVGKVLLVIGVFYFIAWDWMHGRLLTLKNPYHGYRRFFIEILIAFCGYGAARGAVRSEINFLIYIILILLLGAWWSRVTLFEYPESGDRNELAFIQRYQANYVFVIIIFVVLWYTFYGAKIPWWFSFPLTVSGMLFVFFYELENERPPGMIGGPGVPWIGRHLMAKARIVIRRGGG